MCIRDRAVEFLIVKDAKPFSAFRVRPNPILKALLDQLLLCLCDCRFLLVQNGFLFAVCVLYIVEDADIFKVQCFLDYLVGVDGNEYFSRFTATPNKLPAAIT